MFSCSILVALTAAISVLLSLPDAGHAALSFCPEEENYAWSYGGESNGPSTWVNKFPDCGGKMQSPIAIVSTEAIKDENLKKLTFSNYDQPITKGTIFNDGYTIQVNIADGVRRTITVNGSDFSLLQFDMHWGKKKHKGTQHSIDGNKYALEVHLVHKNENNDVIAVAVLFKEGDKRNKAITELQAYFDKVKFKGDKKEILSSINPGKLVPKNPTSYYLYHGSDMHPLCQEYVTWLVVAETINIDKEQMDKFRNQLYLVKKGELKPECKLVNNLRRIQPTNNRKILASQ